MKRWALTLVLAFYAMTVNAYHSGVSETETAASNASCNAAFNSGCVTDADTDTDHEEQTHTASSSGFAAPAGGLGGSALEIALIVLLVIATAGPRVLQSRARRTASDDAS